MRRRIHSLLMAAPLMALFVLSSASAVAAGQDDQLQRLQSALSMLD
jgi:type IV secretory pathway VirB2 component (pilin)